MLTRDLLVARLAQPPYALRPEDRHRIVLAADARVMLAAVLVPIVHRAHEVSVLLTQRASHMHDHPSQISFPGGRVESADSSRTETALREAEEEIGIGRERVTIVGQLPDYEMPSGFRVSPVVGWIEAPLELKLDPFEVASAFEVPMAFVLDPANHQRRSYHFNGLHRHYMAMPYEGRYIWGATAGMLYSLYCQLAEGGPGAG